MAVEIKDEALQPRMNQWNASSNKCLSQWPKHDFIVSAPGKVIVSGEHAVVYGKEAIASAVSLRTELLVMSDRTADHTVTMKLRNLGVRLSWNTADLPWDALSFGREPSMTLDPKQAASIDAMVCLSTQNLPIAVRSLAHSAALAFLYMFMSLRDKNDRGCTYTVQSSIPVGAGLGSSASLCVCFAAGLLLQAGRIAAPLQTKTVEDHLAALELINRWAFVGELCIHGNPSGLDNTVSTYGGTVIFRRASATAPASLTAMQTLRAETRTHRFMLVNTRHPRSSSREISKVARLRDSFPSAMTAIMDAIGAVTNDIWKLLSPDSYLKEDSVTRSIGMLIRVNHGLLCALGVSHTALENVCRIVNDMKAGYAKLTGSGGGGCALVLIDEQLADAREGENVQENLKTALENCGFEIYETCISAPGVGVVVL